MPVDPYRIESPSGGDGRSVNDALDVVRRWPADLPLVALTSIGRDDRWSRWSVFASPARSIAFDAADIDSLRGFLEDVSGASSDGSDRSPFVGGWVLSLRYELGALLEPAAGQRPTGVVASAHHCPDAVVHDNARDEWWRIGNGIPELTAAADSARVFVGEHAIGDRLEYQRAVERALEYIAAGDVYQVNLSHPIRAEFEGSPRTIFAHLASRLAPWYGAYIDEPDRLGATLSLSPELLCEFRHGARRATVRPIKGTRPATAPPDSLRRSAKDRAELAMIVDLTRNDLGRVCVPGSIQVLDAMRPELHGAAIPGDESGVLHGVATVEGVIREDTRFSDLLQALFPAGSITGAPKIRAMQIISEIERRQRGAYCGSVGYVSACGNACMNVGIRTATVSNAQRADLPAYGDLVYPVGAGIVADSVPEQEWHETLNKAAGFLKSLDALRGKTQAATT